VLEMKFPLPPLVEQKRIVKKVEIVMALCEELELKLKYSKTAGEKVMEAVLYEIKAA